MLHKLRCACLTCVQLARRFQSKAAHPDECAFTRSQDGFHGAVGAFVLTCFDAKRRYDLVVRALWWIPQAALIGFAVKIAGWLF